MPTTARSTNDTRHPGPRTLLPQTYEDLWRLALSSSPYDHPERSRATNALLSQTIFRLGDHLKRTDRREFFQEAADTMRRILVERIRTREVSPGNDDQQLLAINEALEEFAKVDPEGAALVNLRLFSGLSAKESAEMLGLSEHEWRRQWVYANAWLTRRVAKRN